MENGIIQLSQMKRDENYLCYFVTTPKRSLAEIGRPIRQKMRARVYRYKID